MTPSTAATWENEGGASAPESSPEARLDWAAFTARFFPEARRHDAAPLAAFEAYRSRRGVPRAPTD